MATPDQTTWNQRYQDAERVTGVSHAVERAAAWLPARGQALDVAGGLGRHAFWLAARGLRVTLLDVSDAAVARVNGWASDEKAPVQARTWDGEVEGLPVGPWDMVVCTHYLQRALFDRFAEALTPGGVLVFSQMTTENLTRHARPSARFLLQLGELSTLVKGLDVLELAEGWTSQGTHEAWVVARKPPGGGSRNAW